MEHLAAEKHLTSGESGRLAAEIDQGMIKFCVLKKSLKSLFGTKILYFIEQNFTRPPNTQKQSYAHTKTHTH